MNQFYMNHNEMKDGFIEEEIMNIIKIPEIDDYFLIQYRTPLKIPYLAKNCSFYLI